MLKIAKSLNSYKVFNFIGYFLNKILKPQVSLFQPISVDIEPTIFCNLKCKFCHNQELKREKKNMSLLEFEKVIDNFPLAIKVNIQGMGEPLINQDIFCMIKYAKSKKKFVTMTTNGMLLDLEKGKKLIDSGLDRLIISLDSANKEIYENVRVGANFERVCGNIKNFVAKKQKNKRPEVVIWMLSLRETIKTLPEMINLVSSFRADRLVLQTNIASWGKDKWFSKARELEVNKSDREVIEIINRSKKLAEKKSINFSVNNKYTVFKKDRIEKCNWPYGGAYVATDGSIIPCCLIADPEVSTLGNVLEEDFKKIWNNKNYQKLRDDLRTGNIPNFCKNCYKK